MDSYGHMVRTQHLMGTFEVMEWGRAFTLVIILTPLASCFASYSRVMNLTPLPWLQG